MHITTRSARPTRFALITAALALAGAAPAQASASPTCINSRFADGHVVLHFDGNRVADHIVVTSLNAPRGARVRVSDGSHSVALGFEHRDENRAAAELRTPLDGSDFTVSIENAGDDAVCLTDVALLSGAHRLSPQVHGSIEAPSDAVPSFVGVYNSTVGNAQRGTLRVAADGTWQLQTPTSVHLGDWQVVLGQLQMRLGHAGPYTAMHVLTQSVQTVHDDAMTAPSAPYQVLMFQGQMLDALRGTFASVSPR